MERPKFKSPCGLIAAALSVRFCKSLPKLKKIPQRPTCVDTVLTLARDIRDSGPTILWNVTGIVVRTTMWFYLLQLILIAQVVGAIGKSLGGSK